MFAFFSTHLEYICMQANECFGFKKYIQYKLQLQTRVAVPFQCLVIFAGADLGRGGVLWVLQHPPMVIIASVLKNAEETIVDS